MIGMACTTLFLRAGFGLGRVWMQESVLWLHALLFLSGAFFATIDDAHVRIEIFRDRWNPRTRHLVERLGHLCLFLPMMLVIGWTSLAPIARSWTQLEESSSAGGLPGLFLLKSSLLVVVIGFLFWVFRAFRRAL